MRLADQIGVRTITNVVIAALLIALFAVVAGLGISRCAVSKRDGGEPRIWSTGPTIEQVQSLNQLVSTKVSVSDVMSAEGEGVKGAWLIKGDALIGIDLNHANIQVIDAQNRRAVIYVPEPRVLWARVDHERSMTWNVERTSWIPWRGDKDRLHDRAMQHAQKLVEFAASQPERIDQTKRDASVAISDIYRQTGWQVQVRWK
jgi:hypothetical protein